MAQADAATRNEAQELARALRRIIRAVDLQSRRIERASGLTLPQLSVLACARALGEQATTRAVAAEAALSDATAVVILDKLEAKGLIERRRSRVDRRIVHTCLTDAGRAALAAAPPVLGERFATAFAALPPADRAEIAAAFAAVADLAGEPVLDAATERETGAAQG